MVRLLFRAHAPQILGTWRAGSDIVPLAVCHGSVLALICTSQFGGQNLVRHPVAFSVTVTFVDLWAGTVTLSIFVVDTLEAHAFRAFPWEFVSLHPRHHSASFSFKAICEAAVVAQPAAS